MLIKDLLCFDLKRAGNIRQVKNKIFMVKKMSIS